MEVTPDINDEAMQGHLGSDFDDNEPASTLGVPASGSPSPAKKGEQLCEEFFNDNVLTDIEEGRRVLKAADMKQIRRLLEVASRINGGFIDSCNMTWLSADGKIVITVRDPRKSEIEGVSRQTT